MREKIRMLKALGLALGVGIGFSAKLFPEEASSKEIKKGKKLFLQYCATCHGEKGRGDGPAASALQPPPRNLADPKYLQKISDEKLFLVIQKGGKAIGKSPLMPPFGDSLSEEEIKSIISFIRSLGKK